MRVIGLAVAMLFLAACDSGTVPSPADRAELRPSTAENEAIAVVLREDGLAVGPESFYFAAGQSEVEAALAKALGEASDSTVNAECGAGPIASTKFPGGLIVNFQNKTLVGWFWNEDTESIKLLGNLGIGTLRSDVQSIDGYAPIDESTLGEEFSLGDKVGGFFEEDKLSVLYSGTQCFFR